MRLLNTVKAETTYTVELTESEIRKIIALAYSFECPDLLRENSSSPYLNFDKDFPEIAEDVKAKQDNNYWSILNHFKQELRLAIR